MTLIPFRRRLKFLATLALLVSLGCGKKPVTTVGAVAACGPMPAKVTLCIELLPVDSSDADLQRCLVNTIDQLIAENQALRVKYGPCAR